MDVIERAKELQSEIMSIEKKLPNTIESTTNKPKNSELLLFDPGELVLSDLRSIDTNFLTPLEALTRIANWKKTLGARRGEDLN